VEPDNLDDGGQFLDDDVPIGNPKDSDQTEFRVSGPKRFSRLDQHRPRLVSDP